MQRICFQEEPIKIVFFARRLSVGGAERQLVELARSLKEKGHDIFVFVMYPGGPLEKELADGGVKTVSLDKKGRWDIFRFFYRLIKATREIEPDIFHGYLTTQNILSATLKPFHRKMKIVWGVRSSMVDLSRYDWLTAATFWLERRLSFMADLIITNSKAGRDLMGAKGYSEKKIIVIPNGIDIVKYYPDKNAGLETKREWAKNAEQKIIGMVGRIDPMKDHPAFLKAAAMLVKKSDDLRFVCVGDGPEKYKEKMVALSNELGLAKKVIWAGSREDMMAVYNGFDVAVCSSYGEGFSNSIAEAMACGIPCVVTDVGDLASIVGETGIVVPPKNPQKLAEGISEMLKKIETDENNIITAARERIAANFSVKTLVDKTSGALWNLL